MLPAPTSVTDASGGVIVTVVVPEPAPPSLSVTVTWTTAVPAAVKVCVALIVDGFVVVPVVGAVPSPQAKL